MVSPNSIDKIAEIKELIEVLNDASKAYYQESREIMSNLEYDRLYDRLVMLEKETNVIMANSPTVNVGYEVLSDLPKEVHPSKMLSLDKTKDVARLKSWLNSKDGVLSWKLDGLTIVLTYENGELIKAVTRGNGEVGEVVTSNARVFTNLPIVIGFKGKLILRGEAVISYKDFEKINEKIEDVESKYKNPRNLCAGSVRQLNNKITSQRNVRFYGFSLVQAEGKSFETREEEFTWLEELGFQVVEHKLVNDSNIEIGVKEFAEKIESNIIPSDGLVLSYNDIAYGRALGQTSKFPRDSIAFKWQDEVKETILKEIEWSPSRTGLINPVAIFEPVELEGTTVSRASVHNISVMEELGLGIGDKISVYKANMIIPQISENHTKSNNISIPSICPVCNGNTIIKQDNGVKTLYCPNENCLAKHIKSFTHFVSRDAMNIDGLSEMTIEKLIGQGFVKELRDLFHVEKYKEQIIEMEGFGEKSFENLKNSIEKARNVKVDRFLYSLGIPNIGVANARLISNYCKNKWTTIRNLSEENLLEIDGIGEVMAKAYVEFFANPLKSKIVDDLLDELNLDESYEEKGSLLEGLTFVITGSLEFYENRDALKNIIQDAGGKVAGSVSSKTSYLINNDVTSTSGKNKKAMELGIKIIDEKTIKQWLETGEVK